MIDLKSESDIEKMAFGGKILASALHAVLDAIKPGISEIELDALAEKTILEKGGYPGFKKVPGYKHTLCISTNETVVHGIPTQYKLQEGDVVGIDCGVFYEGFNTDMAETILVSTQNSKLKTQNSEKERFLKTGKRALEEAIKQAKPGNRVGHISQTIQRIIEKEGYSVVRSLVGHGVGRKLHEEPEIPGRLNDPIEKTPLLKKGMTIAIEAIYNMGESDVVYASSDGWTIKTKDNSLSGVFERSVAITEKGPRILTQ